MAGCVLLSAVLVGPAAAGAIYRCVGSTGETVLTGSAAGYKDCKRIGSTGIARPARAPAALAAPPVHTVPGADARAGAEAAMFQPVSEGKPSLSGVQGSATFVREPPPKASLEGVVASVVLAPGVMTAADELDPSLALATVPAAAPASAGAPTIRAPKGTWDYKESASTDLASLPAPEPAKGTRVLRGAVYRITRADGGVEYTNIPQAAAGLKGQSIKMLFTYIATCAACDVHSKIDWNNVGLNLSAYGEAIASASHEFGVDEALLRAIIHAESAFNPRALSVAGAQGLMQLIPGTARDMGVLDAFDADQNIRGGARYLALLLKNFNGNERLAAAAYNAGPGAVQKYNGVPPYDETQVYVERVGVLRKRYGETLKQRPVVGVPLATRGE